MKKAQITIYLIVALLMLLSAGFLLFANSTIKKENYVVEAEKTLAVSEVRLDLNAYMRNCVKFSLEKSMQEIGLSEDTIPEFEQKIHEKVDRCFDELFVILSEQQFNIDQGSIDVTLEITQEVVLVEVTYPIVLERNDQRTEFYEFVETFERTNWVDIPGGIAPADLIIPTTDGKAQLFIPAGTAITDIEGNPIENFALRVEDKNFDNLNNGVVIGNMVVEGMPDGAQFNPAVTLSIDFNQGDVPPGVALDNLAIAWFDHEFGIWRGRSTQIIDGDLVAQIEHFTEYAGTNCNQNTWVCESPLYASFRQLYDEGAGWNSLYSDTVTAKKGKEFYSKHLAPGYEWGYYEGSDFVSCPDIEGFYDEDGDPMVQSSNNPQYQCEYYEDLDPLDPNAPPIATAGVPECNGRNVGAHCGGSDINTCQVDEEFGIPGPNDEFVFCKCVEPNYEEKKVLGYQNADCVGGRRRNELAIDSIAFMDGGDTCLMEPLFPNNFYAYTVGKDNGADQCFINPYGDGQTFHELVIDEVYNVGIYEIEYRNSNKNEKANCGVTYCFKGIGSQDPQII